MRFWLREKFSLRPGIVSILRFQLISSLRYGLKSDIKHGLSWSLVLGLAAVLTGAGLFGLITLTPCPSSWPAVVLTRGARASDRAEIQEEVINSQNEGNSENPEKQGPSLASVLAEIEDTSPRLRNEISRVRQLEREMAEIEARAFWQLNMRGGYLWGTREITGSASPLSSGDTGNAPAENAFRDSFQEMNLSLESSRNFLSGPGLTGRLEYRDNNPVDLDNLSDNLELTLSANYKLWPRVPAEPVRVLIALEENLELARRELKLARENLYLELLEDYLEIAFLKEELELNREELSTAKQGLEKARQRQQLGEAGELEIRESDLAVQRAENGVASLEELLERRRTAFQQNLGTEEPVYQLDSSLLKNLAGINFAYPGYSAGKRLELRLKSAPEYQRLEQSLARESRELDWWKQEQQPEIAVSGSQEIRSGNWQAGVEFSYSLYDGDLSRLQVEEFQETAGKLEKDQAELSTALEQELISALGELERLERNSEEARIELEIAELNLEKQLESYERGAIDGQELEISRREVRRQQLELKERSFDRILAALNLDSSLSISWIEEEIADVKN